MEMKCNIRIIHSILSLIYLFVHVTRVSNYALFENFTHISTQMLLTQRNLKYRKYVCYKYGKVMKRK